MHKIIHAVAGTGALLLVSTFWLSTVVSEFMSSEASVVAVKAAILRGLPIMVLFIAAVGGSGPSLADRARAGRIGAKPRQMPFIAASGLLVLIPCAVVLAWRAIAGQFDATFYAVQTVELAAGAVNITFQGLNMRDGIAMARGWPLKKLKQARLASV